MLRELFRKYLVIAVIALVIVVVDQWTKGLVRANVPHGERWLPESWAWLMPYARIVHYYNTGAAFGLFKNASMVLTVLAFIVIAAIILYYPHVGQDDWSLRLALSMQLGGAIGNLLDRLSIGHVTDFISVGKFPVFNVADASITVGAVVLFIGVWLQERAEKKEREERALSQIKSEPRSE